MKKLYLILLLLCMVNVGLSAKAHRGIHNNPKGSLWDMPPCDTPKVNPDSLLLQYYTHRPLSVTGGTPPYTYTFSPAISTSSLVALLTSTVTTVYTITVTGANGCSSTYNATYVPLLSGSAGGSCTTIFIDQYIQDTVHHDIGLELYNPTGIPVSLNSYYLMGTTNGSLYATPFFIQLHGTIPAYSTYLIANRLADTSLTHKAGMLSDSLSFGGKDIVSLAKMVVSPPNLTVSFLDMVGAITPLPTDSGWAVGSGSTKNHTLVRLVSTSQGDLNWGSCQSQWNVYARGTSSYIGHYVNACHIDPTLSLSMVDVGVRCGNPSIFSFNVMATSQPRTILNECTIEIKYTGTAFAGDDVNNGIYIDAGPNFQDYTNNIKPLHLTDSTFLLQFGPSGDSSYNGTWLNDTAQEMMNIAFRIQDPCGTGKLELTDTAGNFATYADIDSVGHPDSTKSYYDTIRYVCRDSVVPAYPCHAYCCHLDSLGHCDDTCYDTCYTVPIYCTDTIWHYRPDTAYTIISYSNLPYTHIITPMDDSEMCGADYCPPTIGNFTAPIDAGVGEVLTITGANFGPAQGTGQVKFFDADTANYRIQRLNNIDYLSWTNSQIQIRLPSIADTVLPTNSGKELTIGGGNFVVTNSCGDSAISDSNTSHKPFSVYYNINQYWNRNVTPNQKAELLLRSTDSNGGYLLRFDSVTFPQHSLKRLIFEKAMRDWTCFVGMNWTVGKDTTYAYTPNNYTAKVNYVFFTPYLLPASKAAQTDIDIGECPDSIIIVREAVTYFNSDTTHIRFIYDTTGTVTIPTGDFDFYGVCLHELGHFIELRHSTDPTSLMYYTANQGPIAAANRITLGLATSAAAVDGGLYSVLHSAHISDVCAGFSAMVGENTSCVNTTSIYSMQKPQVDFSIYPNPSKGTFTVQSSINDYTLTVINMLGQRILSKNIRNEKSIIDISNQPNGMYFILEQYNNGRAIQKLIINR